MMGKSVPGESAGAQTWGTLHTVLRLAVKLEMDRGIGSPCKMKDMDILSLGPLAVRSGRQN